MGADSDDKQRAGSGGGNGAGECVRVVVRCRPLASKEVADGRQRVVEVDGSLGQVVVRNPRLDAREPGKAFTFDLVHDWNCAREVVASVLRGYNGTVFAYGQTGTGKTHTMEGTDSDRGIIPQAFNHIFEEIEGAGGADRDYLVRASFLEIYNEEIRDLLAPSSSGKGGDIGKRPHYLELKESTETGVYVKDLTSFVVKGVAEIRNVLQVGKKNRTVGATLMNQDSSRSHSIFTITIESSDRSSDPNSSGHIRAGKLHLVDLAGSERLSKTGATGDRLKEATKINLSLSALGNVISALVDGRSGHVPYRDSKLTRLLQDSLGGNTKTVMVANIGPADYNYDETINTLRYANRAKNITNKPRVNEDPKDAMLREFQEEIARLKGLLQSSSTGEGGSNNIHNDANLSASMNEEQLEHVRRQVRKEMEEAAMLAAASSMSAAQAVSISEEAVRAQVEAAAAADREALISKLRAMEEKLIHGDPEKLLQKAEEKDAELRRIREAENAAAERIAQLEEAQQLAEGHYASIQEEVEHKTRKLKQLFKKVHQKDLEIQDMNEEFQQEREDMLDTIRELTQQLKLKSIVVEAFVPPEEAAKIARRARWDDERQEWHIIGLEHAGNKSNNMRMQRPMSEYARIASAGGNPRFRADNVLALDLDMPERTTYDYDAAAIRDPRVQAAVDAAFADEGEMLFMDNNAGTTRSVYFSYKDHDTHAAADYALTNHNPNVIRPKSARRKEVAVSNSSSKDAAVTRPKTARKVARTPSRAGSADVVAAEEAPVYPTARGLVRQ
eukprot:jgi/Chlat1/6630/Chrsp482S00879